MKQWLRNGKQILGGIIMERNVTEYPENLLRSVLRRLARYSKIDIGPFYAAVPDYESFNIAVLFKSGDKKGRVVLSKEFLDDMDRSPDTEDRLREIAATIKLIED
jgi:hypothetical protein